MAHGKPPRYRVSENKEPAFGGLGWPHESGELFLRGTRFERVNRAVLAGVRVHVALA